MAEKKASKRESVVRPRDLSIILKDAPAGVWVVLSHDKTRVVAAGSSMQAATLSAELQGEKDPILVKMPLEDDGMAAGVR